MVGDGGLERAAAAGGGGETGGEEELCLALDLKLLSGEGRIEEEEEEVERRACGVESVGRLAYLI